MLVPSSCRHNGYIKCWPPRANVGLSLFTWKWSSVLQSRPTAALNVESKSSENVYHVVFTCCSLKETRAGSGISFLPVHTGTSLPSPVNSKPVPTPRHATKHAFHVNLDSELCPCKAGREYFNSGLFDSEYLTPSCSFSLFIPHQRSHLGS